jgi:hypothetical protein
MGSLPIVEVEEPRQQRDPLGGVLVGRLLDAGEAAVLSARQGARDRFSD